MFCKNSVKIRLFWWEKLSFGSHLKSAVNNLNYSDRSGCDAFYQCVPTNCNVVLTEEEDFELKLETKYAVMTAVFERI